MIELANECLSVCGVMSLGNPASLVNPREQPAKTILHRRSALEPGNTSAALSVPRRGIVWSRSSAGRERTRIDLPDLVSGSTTRPLPSQLRLLGGHALGNPVQQRLHVTRRHVLAGIDPSRS